MIAPPIVSIVLPPFAAADSLETALLSLRSQGAARWEAIALETGPTRRRLDSARSTDPALDPRLRVVRVGSPLSRSAALNLACKEARSDWMLFLEPGSWLEPPALATWLEAAARHPEIELWHARSRRVDAAGHDLSQAGESLDSASLVEQAQSWASGLSPWLIRREAIGRAGGFDESLDALAGWDLLLRLTRAGASARELPREAPLVNGRSVSSPAPFDMESLLHEGNVVLRRAAGVGNRGSDEAGRGEGRAEAPWLPATWNDFLPWLAGLALRTQASPFARLDTLPGARFLEPDPRRIAEILWLGIVLGGEETLSELGARWPTWAPRARDAATGIAHRLGCAEMAPAIVRDVARSFLFHAPPEAGWVEEDTCFRTLDLDAPLPAAMHGPGCSRLMLRAARGERVLGVVLLPLFEDRIRAESLRSALAAFLGWQILGEFFGRTLYPRCAADADRGLVRARMPQLAAASPAHDEIGWLAALQEIWGAPDLSMDAFYDRNARDERDRFGAWRLSPTRIEVARALPRVAGRQGWIELEVALAGVPIARVKWMHTHRWASPTELRSIVNCFCDRGLVETAVAQAIIGSSSAAPLRDGLREAASSRPGRPRSTGGRTIVLGRRRGTLPATGPSRHADLPRTCATLLRDLWASGGDAVLDTGGESSPIDLELDPRWIVDTMPFADHGGASDTPAARQGGARHEFESLFARRADPWGYDSPYESEKYEQTLDLALAHGPRSALEVACAEGHFTTRLAPRVDRLLAVDISSVALTRAAARIGDSPRVSFRQVDIVADELPSGFDLVVCSEVLYFTGDRERLQLVGSKLAAALAEDGRLVCAHANVKLDEPQSPGFSWEGIPFGAKTIGAVFGRIPGLVFDKELRTRHYRIQVFRRETGRAAGDGRPLEIIAARSREPEPDVRRHFVDAVPGPGADTETSREPRWLPASVPILMYHQIASNGPDALRPYRVAPAQFEEQIRYLRAAGFTSLTLARWRDLAYFHRRPEGRAVVLTFDDATTDFGRVAWPCLQRYGFDATLFVPTSHLGGHAQWNANHGPPAALHTAEEIRRLARSGVQIGSHGASHRRLTMLDPEAVVRDLATSRLVLQRLLGSPVTALAYPYGARDEVVHLLAGACGFDLGVLAGGGRSRDGDDLLALPRVPISGGMSFAEFVAALGE